MHPRRVPELKARLRGGRGAATASQRRESSDMIYGSLDYCICYRCCTFPGVPRQCEYDYEHWWCVLAVMSDWILVYVVVPWLGQHRHSVTNVWCWLSCVRLCAGAAVLPREETGGRLGTVRGVFRFSSSFQIWVLPVCKHIRVVKCGGSRHIFLQH